MTQAGIIVAPDFVKMKRLFIGKKPHAACRDSLNSQYLPDKTNHQERYSTNVEQADVNQRLANRLVVSIDTNKAYHRRPRSRRGQEEA